MDEVLPDRSNEHANEARSSTLTEQIELRVRRERHRRWRPEEKLQILRETLHPGAVIAEVAQRHGIGTGLLYTWRKAMLATAVSGLVPVAVRTESDNDASAPRSPESVSAAAVPVARAKPATGRIEIEFPGGVRVRVDGGVDATVLRGILTALDDR